jgi:hypothetical protein
MHSALIDEWTPSGLSEESKVFGMADAEWRKLRSRRFAQAKAIANSLNTATPLSTKRAATHVSRTRNCVRRTREQIPPCRQNRYLNQKFPRKNFESIKELALAVLEEIKSALLPGTPGFAALDPATLDPATQAFCTEIIKMTEVFNTEIIKSNRRFSQQLLSAAHRIAHHQKRSHV